MARAGKHVYERANWQRPEDKNLGRREQPGEAVKAANTSLQIC